ncbi:MAG TPA: SpvB/TcaC N-terminal domain-containing protein [Candidatus Paceibacterota bacterium]|nr:SpvB/TcaC N-terminal domain-containing protein [Candidatus Paceibacterota bacterium]
MYSTVALRRCGRAIVLFVLCNLVLSLIPPSLVDAKEREDIVSASVGRVRVDLNQGAYTDSISFKVPPGRKGLTPDLALTYNSQDLSESPYGYGWKLSIPSITRMNQIGTDRLYIDNYFTSSLGGELVPSDNNGGYRHRFEDGNFITYRLQNNVWTVFDKSGTRYSFGTTTASRQSATTSPDNVYRWMLEEVRDTNDNFIKFEYTKDGNQIYPSKITYTGNGTTDGPFEVDFTYETRPDVYTSYETGFWVNTTKRLTEVKASINDEWRRKYTLGYLSGSNGSRSLLISAIETGRDSDGNTAALPAVTFGYSTSTPTYASSTNPRIWNSARMVADVDGNGLPDKAVFWSNSGTSSAHRIVDENEFPNFPQYNQAVSSEFWSYDNSGLGGSNDFPYVERGVRLVDFNGDGKADIARSYRDSSGVITRGYYENTAPFTWTSTATPSRLPLFSCANGSESVATGLFGNLNGDWLVDYVATTTICAANGSYLNSGLENGWRVKSSFAPIAAMPTTATDVSMSQLVDVNGDGLDDWMYSDASSTKFYLNNGSSWGSVDTRWTINTGVRQTGGWDKGIRFIDMNGDGLLDYIRSYNMPSYSTKASGVTDIQTGSYNYVYLNTGGGFATSSLTVPEYIFNGVVSGGQWTGRVDYNELVDWNGDGIPDSASTKSTVSSGGTAKADMLTFRRLSTGGNTQIEYQFSAQMASQNPDLPFSILVVTKLTDNDGFGGSQSYSYTYEGGRIYLNPSNTRDRRFAGFAKINRFDGLGSTQSYYHQGNTASTSVGELLDGFALIGKKYREDVVSMASTTLKKSFYVYSSDQYITSATTSTSTTDIARGSSQFSNVASGSSHSYSFTVGSSDNMLLVIGDSQGGLFVSGVTYNGIALTPVGAGASAASNRNVNLWYLLNPPTGTHTLTMTRGGLDGWFGAHAISYSGVDTENPFGWYDAEGGISGTSVTATVTTDTPNAWLVGVFGSTAGSHSVNSGAFIQTSDTESWDSGGGLGAVGAKSVIYSSTNSGTMLKNVIALNPSRTISSPTPAYWFTRLASDSVQDFEGGSTHKDRATEYSYSTTTGNLLQSIERGEVTGSSDGTYSNTGSDTRTTIITYSATTSKNLTLPTTKEVKDNSGTSVALTRLYYDTQSLGTAVKGNLTKEEKWISGSDYSSTTKAYNSYGLVTSETDPRSNTTTYSYDSFNLYPETVTNALSQGTDYEYDYMVGKPIRVEDENGTVRRTVFEPLGRVQEERQTNPSFPLLTEVLRDYVYTDTFPASTRTRTYLTSASTTDVYTYRDGLGRVIQERSQAEMTNRYSVKSYVYGSAGLLAKESLPYFASTSARTSPTHVSSLYTNYTYDALQRPVSIATSIGTTTYAYTPWQVKVTDANGVPKDIQKDAYGNVSSVVEYNDEETYTTSYTHDALNNLVGMTDSLGNTRSFSYDGLSRRTTAQDLHASGDSTYGVWNYAYDLFGNLASSTDPKAQNIVNSYDALNRKLTENYTGASGTEHTYTYDSCDNGVGRLCVASSTSAQTTFDYDILGNVDSEAKKIGNKTYTTSYTYDRRGSPLTVTLPNGVTQGYNYNNAGTIDSVAHAGNPIVTDLNYGPHGKLAAKKFANGIETHYAYDSNALYRLVNILTTYTSGLTLSESSSKSHFALSRLKEITQVLFAPSVYAQEIENPSNEDVSNPTPESSQVEPAVSADEVSTQETEKTSDESSPNEISEPVTPEEALIPKDAPPELETDVETQDEVVSDDKTIVPIEPLIVPVVASTTASTSEARLRTESKVVEKILSVTPAEPGSIRALLEGKGSYKRANIKGEEIAKAVRGVREKRKDYTFEIVSVEPIEGGVQVFVRAWDSKGKRIGFGVDGTVDMERFRIFNPPILVPDERGTIRQEWTQTDVSTGEEKQYVRTLREDPREALLQVIEHNLSVMKNIHGPERIIKGKKGKTVSTFYSAAGQASPVDGMAYWNGSGDWASAHDSNGVISCDTCAGGEVGIRVADYYFQNLVRNIFGFNTSLIDSDMILSATLSVTMHSGMGGGTNPGDFKVVVDKHDGPASSNAIVNNDYNIANWDSVRQSNTEIAINTISTRQYYNFPFNSTGLGNINKSGNTWLGLRIGLDLDNTSPGWRDHRSYNAETVFADTTGTTEDPKLVIEHTGLPPIEDPFPNANGTRLQDILYYYDSVGNITSIIEAATSSLARKVNYAYDDLSRLVSASTTATSSVSFRELYSYNKIGNLKEKILSNQVEDNFRSTDLELSSSQFWSIADASQTGLDMSTVLTFSAWIKPESFDNGTIQTLVHKGDASQESYKLYMYNAGGTHMMFFRPSSSGAYEETLAWTLGSTIPTGAWTHVVFTWTGSGSVGELWINGVSQGTQTGSVTSLYNSARKLAIGAMLETDSVSTYYVDGLMDDVRIWSRKLTSTEIGNFYSDPYNFSNGSSLQGWWKLDSNGQDSSGNANHLTNNNGATFSTDVAVSQSAPSSLYLYSGSGYLNPHAPSEYFDGTASTTYTYDNNGNLTSSIFSSATTTYTWDFLNRLVSATTTGTTTAYTYDHTMARMSETVGSKVHHYPNKFYSAEYTDSTYQTGTSTSYIWAGDTLIAYVERPIVSGSPSGTAKTYYVHPDHLESTNVVTNEAGDVILEKDYMPYGSMRVEDGTDSNRGFIGQFENEGNNLSYLNARYYEGARGQFLSQDPVFWEVGLTNDGMGVLTSPQLQNSYAYAGDNPVTLKDPSGRIIDTIADIGFIAYDLYRVGEAMATGGDVRTELNYLSLDVAGAVIPGVTGVGVVARTTKVVNKVDNVAEKSFEIYAKMKDDIIYTGRTSGKSIPEKNVIKRDRTHHMNEQGYGPARLIHSTNSYNTVRGLEQIGQDVANSVGRSGNAIRGISPSNKNAANYLNISQKEVETFVNNFKRITGIK